MHTQYNRCLHVWCQQHHLACLAELPTYIRHMCWAHVLRITPVGAVVPSEPSSILSAPMALAPLYLVLASLLNQQQQHSPYSSWRADMVASQAT